MTVRKPLAFLPLLVLFPILVRVSMPAQPGQQTIFGYADFSKQAKIEEKFLAVPDAKLAGEALKTLTAEPHLASTPEDHKTAEYVAQKFRAAGLDTEIVPYRVLMNQPKVAKVEAFNAAGQLLMSGPTREHVEGDAFEDDPQRGDAVQRVVGIGRCDGRSGVCELWTAGGFRPAGRAAYRPARQDRDRALRVEFSRGEGLHGGAARRGGSADLFATRRMTGTTRAMRTRRPVAAGDGGAARVGAVSVQVSGRPGDAGRGVDAGSAGLARVSPNGNQPHIISIPISYHDATPILQALKGASVPQGWQGALPFRYHVGPGGVKVHLVSEQDYQRRTIWDVIGKVKGTDYPDEWVVVGNHRDAWVYGAVDPNSGTAAMLEAVHGVGALLKRRMAAEADHRVLQLGLRKRKA